MSVFVATPCYAGQLHVAAFRSLFGIAGILGEKGIDCQFLVVEGEAAITRGRSNIASAFLKSKCKTLAMIDADILIEAEDFLKLYKMNKPIRGAAVALKTTDHSERLNVVVNDKRKTRSQMPDSPFIVQYLGGAVMLVERAVIKKLSSLKKLQYNDEINGPGAHIFQERIVDGTLLTEDFAFCELAKRHGFSTWCDPSIIVSHFGPSFWRA